VGAGETFFINENLPDLVKNSNYDNYVYLSPTGVESINEVFEALFYCKKALGEIRSTLAR